MDFLEWMDKPRYNGWHCLGMMLAVVAFVLINLSDVIPNIL